MVDQAQGCSGQLRWQDEFDELFDKLAMSTVQVSESGAVGPAGAGPTAGSPPAPTAGRAARERVGDYEGGRAVAPEPRAPRAEGRAPRAQGPAERPEGRAERMRRTLAASRSNSKKAPSAPMKEGLRYLFSGPSAAEGLAQAPPVTVGAAEQSPFFHAFLRDVASSGSVLSTGYSRLDRLLAGGFRPGLYLLSGHRGRMRRLFLDNLMWGAVGEGTPVSYLAIQTGAQSAWERMIVTLGRLVGEPLTIGDLRVFPHPGQVVERVGRLDATLVRSVLPQVALEDSILTDPALPSSFLAALDARLAGDTSPRLVLVDSLPRLMVLLQVDGLQASSAFAWELDRLLCKRSSVGVAASGQEPDPELRDVVQGLLRLDPVDDGSGTGPERLLVSVHERSRGVESAQFVADEASGLLA